ncbi:hypothetical protein COV94_07060, partial [Candidatus Woesearchaeota archaeon CG11_big_fil_rev_8_21_14_0_20_57_5]
MASMFREVIVFFGDLGIYDVVLPFLLVFTIMFAVLEKSKILGMEHMSDGSKVTKKNLNSMVAFVVAFFVVASSQLVGILNEALGNIVIVMMVSVSFLLLIGTFYSDDEEVFLQDAWRKLFMVLMFIGVLLIFLHAVKTSDGTPWLEWFWDWLVGNWDSTAASSIIMIVVLIAILYY